MAATNRNGNFVIIVNFCTTFHSNQEIFFYLPVQRNVVKHNIRPVDLWLVMVNEILYCREYS